MLLQPPLNVQKVLSRLRRHEYQAFLVGGCVRDALLDKEPNDWDVSTDATPDEIIQLFDNGRIIGKRFPIVHVRFRDEVVEVVTFRSSDSEFGTMIDDAYRRDFTANALYCCTESDEIIDPFTGKIDLKNRVVRVIGSPTKRFKEDPVRMLRAIRLLTQCGLKIPAALKQDIQESAELLREINPSRMYHEFQKTFDLDYNQSHSINNLREFKLLKYFLPEGMLGSFEISYGQKQYADLLSGMVWEYYSDLVKSCRRRFNLYPIPASQKAAKLLVEQLEAVMKPDRHVSRSLKELLISHYRSESSP